MPAPADQPPDDGPVLLGPVVSQVVARLLARQEEGQEQEKAISEPGGASGAIAGNDRL
jgi:hypothetical protein